MNQPACNIKEAYPTQIQTGISGGNERVTIHQSIDQCGSISGVIIDKVQLLEERLGAVLTGIAYPPETEDPKPNDGSTIRGQIDHITGRLHVVCRHLENVIECIDL